MTRPAVGSGRRQRARQSGIDRAARLARLPLSSPAGTRRSGGWLASYRRKRRGQGAGLAGRATSGAGALCSTASPKPHLSLGSRARRCRRGSCACSKATRRVIASLLAKTARAAGARHARRKVMRILRRMKADAALLIALADIGGVWPVARVTARAHRRCRNRAAVAVHYLLRDAPGAAGSSPAAKDPEQAPAISCWRWGRWAAMNSTIPATSISWFFSMPDAARLATASSRRVLRPTHPRSREASAGAHD